MGNKFSFTKEAVDDLPAPEKGRAYYYDTKVSKLQLQVTATGAKSYYVYRRIKGKAHPDRVFIARHPDITPAKARTEAEKIIGEIATGGDPNARKRLERAETVTLEDAFILFLKVRRLKPKTAYDYEKVIERAFKDWKKKQLGMLTKDMVASRYHKLTKDSGPAYATLAMRVLRAVYNFAAAQYEDAQGNSLLPPNPVKRLSDTRAWNRETRRAEYLTADQLPAWFGAVLAYKTPPAEPVQVAVSDWLLLLVLTGLRRKEGLGLTWEQVNFENRTFTIPDTKNREPLTLPLSDYLHDLLKQRSESVDGPWVFPSNRLDKAGRPIGPLTEVRRHEAAIEQAAGFTFRPHDLRRTFITYADRLDISAWAVRRLVNHKMSGDVTAGYIGRDVERLRKPMQAVTDFILRAGKVLDTPVIPLKQGTHHE